MKLQVLIDERGRLFAPPSDFNPPANIGYVNKGNPRAPASKGKLVELDCIRTVKSIDWGSNHCVFVDHHNRVWAIGQHRFGCTGLAKTFIEKKKDLAF